MSVNESNASQSSVGSEVPVVVKPRAWIMYSVLTVCCWGGWGAVMDVPKSNGFPNELGYIMWAFSMLLPAIFALKAINWRLDVSLKAIGFGAIIGGLGAGGQLILYSGAIENGPAYLIFPIIALAPVVTIFMSLFFLKERAGILGWVGIGLALLAVLFMNYQDPTATAGPSGWLIFALLVFLAWGVQGFFLKTANAEVSAESIFVYMAITSIILAPIAWFMVGEPRQANWSMSGAGLAFAIGLLNAFGALFLVYAYRYGKAIVVSPLVNCLPPIVTSILSLIILSVVPSTTLSIGLLMAVVSAFLLTLDEER